MLGGVLVAVLELYRHFRPFYPASDPTSYLRLSLRRLVVSVPLLWESLFEAQGRSVSPGIPNRLGWL